MLTAFNSGDLPRPRRSATSPSDRSTMPSPAWAEVTMSRRDCASAGLRVGDRGFRRCQPPRTTRPAGRHAGGGSTSGEDRQRRAAPGLMNTDLRPPGPLAPGALRVTALDEPVGEIMQQRRFPTSRASAHRRAAAGAVADHDEPGVDLILPTCVTSGIARAAHGDHIRPFPSCSNCAAASRSSAPQIHPRPGVRQCRGLRQIRASWKVAEDNAFTHSDVQ